MFHVKLTVIDESAGIRVLRFNEVVSIMPTYRDGDGVEIRAVNGDMLKAGRIMYASHVFLKADIRKIEIDLFNPFE